VFAKTLPNLVVDWGRSASDVSTSSAGAPLPAIKGAVPYNMVFGLEPNFKDVGCGYTKTSSVALTSGTAGFSTIASPGWSWYAIYYYVRFLLSMMETLCVSIIENLKLFTFYHHPNPNQNAIRVELLSHLDRIEASHPYTSWRFSYHTTTQRIRFDRRLP